jgi:hypothetical protein
MVEKKMEVRRFVRANRDEALVPPRDLECKIIIS